MKLLVAIAFLGAGILPATHPRTVFVEDTYSSDAYSARLGMELRGGYTQAALIKKRLRKCDGVTIVSAASDADFVVQIIKGRVILEDGSGHLLYTSPSRNELTMGKDVCRFVTATSA